MSVKRLLHIDTGFANLSNLGKSSAGFNFDDFMKFFTMIAGTGIQGKADFLVSISAFKERDSASPLVITKKSIEEALPRISQFAPFYSVSQFNLLINFPVFSSFNPEFEITRNGHSRKKNLPILDWLLTDYIGTISFTPVKIAEFYPIRVMSDNVDEATMFGGFVYAELFSCLVEFDKLCGKDGPFELVNGVINGVNESCFKLFIEYIEDFIRHQKMTIVGKPKFSFKEGPGSNVTHTPLNMSNNSNVYGFKATYCLCHEPKEGETTSEAANYVFLLRPRGTSIGSPSFYVTMNRVD